MSAGAAVFDAATAGRVGHLARCIAPGSVLLALAFVFSQISGARINPAVTLAFVARGVFPLKRVFAYRVSQVAGATVSGLALAAAFGSAAHHGATHMSLALSSLAGGASEAVLEAAQGKH